MCHYMPFRNVSLFNGIKIPEDLKWEIVMPEKWFFRENLVDFTRKSFFSQQHLENMRGLPGPGDGRNSWNSVLCTERNTRHSDCMGAQISTRSLRKKPAEQVFRVVQAGEGRRKASEERETPIACVSCSTPASCFVRPKNEKKISPFCTLSRKKP